MKWFKHYTNAHKGGVIHALIPEFGWPESYGLYFLLVEYLTDKWDGVSEPIFRFSPILLRKYLELSPKKFRKLGEILSDSSQINFKFSDDFVEINFPKLLEIRHRDAIPSSHRLEKIQTKSGLEKNKRKKKSNTTDFLNLDSLLAAIPEETKRGWARLYAKEFIDRELIKAWSYYLDNKPKNLRGWSRALSSWLERSHKWDANDAKSKTPLTGGWAD